MDADCASMPNVFSSRDISVHPKRGDDSDATKMKRPDFFHRGGGGHFFLIAALPPFRLSRALLPRAMAASARRSERTPAVQELQGTPYPFWFAECNVPEVSRESCRLWCAWHNDGAGAWLPRHEAFRLSFKKKSLPGHNLRKIVNRTISRSIAHPPASQAQTQGPWHVRAALWLVNVR